MALPQSPHRYGLVLTGGGARAAYQAGVLQGISEILGESGPSFRVITGVSAGAINSAFLASSDPRQTHAGATRRLSDLWANLQVNDVYRTDVRSFSQIGAGWVKDLTFGGLFGAGRSLYLMDASPLRGFLKDKIDFERIQANIAEGLLGGFAVSATNYQTGTATTFFEGEAALEPWVRSSRVGFRARITLDHILASAAIPILFPPVKVDGVYFGDGGVRLITPLSPAIHLGSDRVLAIGVRYLRPSDLTLEMNLARQTREISIADIAGVMMNAAFLDTLDSDLERMMRINQTVALLSEKDRARHPHKLRQIPVLAIHPSRDLGTLACEQFRKFPRALRYMLKGIGASEERGWDLLSYLAFDPAYTTQLLELGRGDALAKKPEILQFFGEKESVGS